MRKRFLSALILITALLIGQNVYADVEEDVVVITNVPYEAKIIKNASNESATVNPADGTHTGMSSVFTLQTNGGDLHFDYILTAQINAQGGPVSAYTNDGHLLFAHQTVLPTSDAVANARAGMNPSKNVFAYPINVSTTGGYTSTFIRNYKTYGNCYAIFVNDNETGNVTHTISGNPVANTYEAGLDEAGSYRATMLFTVVSK